MGEHKGRRGVTRVEAKDIILNWFKYNWYKGFGVLGSLSMIELKDYDRKFCGGKFKHYYRVDHHFVGELSTFIWLRELLAWVCYDPNMSTIFIDWNIGIKECQ